MIPPALINEIKNDPFLQRMAKHVVAFDRYLESTSHLNIKLKGIRYGLTGSDGETLDPQAQDINLGYPHMWSKQHDRDTLRRLYNLKYHYLAHPPKYTMMITYTGSHASPRHPEKGGLGHMAYLAKFQNAHRLGKKMVGKYLLSSEYLSMLEGHPKSGYVHAHDLYFLNTLPTSETLSILQNHWNHTLKMGSDAHGIKIEIKEAKDFKDIESLIAYPLSYLGGSQISTLDRWTKYDAVFNASLWLSGKGKMFGGLGKRARALQPSRTLSTVMNRRINGGTFEHIETTLDTDLNTDTGRVRDSHVLNRPEDYDKRVPVWVMFGGDDGRYATLTELQEMKRNDAIRSF